MLNESQLKQEIEEVQNNNFKDILYNYAIDEDFTGTRIAKEFSAILDKKITPKRVCKWLVEYNIPTIPTARKKVFLQYCLEQDVPFQVNLDRWTQDLYYKSHSGIISHIKSLSAKDFIEFNHYSDGNGPAHEWVIETVNIDKATKFIEHNSASGAPDNSAQYKNTVQDDDVLKNNSPVQEDNDEQTVTDKLQVAQDIYDEIYHELESKLHDTEQKLQEVQEVNDSRLAQIDELEKKLSKAQQGDIHRDRPRKHIKATVRGVQNNRCAKCGRTLPPDEAFHHIVLKSTGSMHGIGEVVLVCKSCHDTVVRDYSREEMKRLNLTLRDLLLMEFPKLFNGEVCTNFVRKARYALYKYVNEQRDLAKDKHQCKMGQVN